MKGIPPHFAARRVLQLGGWRGDHAPDPSSDCPAEEHVHEPRKDESIGATSRKQAYRSPTLQVFGALAALTAKVDKTSTNFDGASGAKSKTA
jgi:hypothetical protein